MWTNAKLGEIADIVSGGTPSTKIPEFWMPEIEWITAKDISESATAKIRRTERYISKEGLENSPAKMLPALSTVLIARGATMGKCKMIAHSMAMNQTCYAIVAKETTDPVFLYYAISNLYDHFRAMAHGSIFDTVIGSGLREVNIPFPPIAEQRAIAHILGTLDDKIELNRRMNETLEAIARALFKSWFVDFDPVRAKMEGRQPFGMNAETAALFPDGFEDSEIGEIPRGWRKTSILDFANLLSGGTPSTSVNEYWDGDIPWVSAKDVGNANRLFVLDTDRYITTLGLENSSTKILPAKTTIVTARGSVGAYCLLGRDMAMNQTNYGLRAKNSSSDYFVYWSLVHLVDELKQQAYGTIFDTVTTRTFEDSKTIYPPLSVIARFEGTVFPFMERILANQKESQTLDALRDTLLPKLISGEVRVNDMETLKEESNESF